MCYWMIYSVVPFQDRLCWNLRHHVCGSAHQFIKGASLFHILACRFKFKLAYIIQDTFSMCVLQS